MRIVNLATLQDRNARRKIKEADIHNGGGLCPAEKVNHRDRTASRLARKSRMSK